jgi:hypothetical protein
VDDYISWEVEVGKTGTYEVELWYACPKDDLGSKIILSCGKEFVMNKISEANDPPLVGMNEDRSPRMESYVKAFKPMKMGELKLSAGIAELKLKATKIPGQQALEFRLIMLRRL